MTPRTPYAHEIHREGRRTYSQDDGELVALAVARMQEGDCSALHCLYVRYAEDVHRYVKSIVRDHHEAEDITQSLFLKLIPAIHGYRPRSVPLKRGFCAWHATPRWIAFVRRGRCQATISRPRTKATIRLPSTAASA